MRDTVMFSALMLGPPVPVRRDILFVLVIASAVLFVSALHTLVPALGASIVRCVGRLRTWE